MSRDPGVPLGSGPEEGAADAEPTTVTPPPAPPAGEAAPPPIAPPAPPASAAAPPLAIPGLPLDRPELHVGAAFLGGVVLAQVLKRFAR
ncbi:hypothetical protein [Conexibacter arvalis]|uniref:3-oxoacyl-ACP reductase-like protein n=1 Tax=Conexibacter arvalis TaxID=912552 RepID=A0A840ID67_9ACTN|nr:hypothetical protein [Conexibacter arvalis]MBB4662702.1 3-oxoacyl-ACP reductase-like protein [Conexibacter arvalis]